LECGSLNISCLACAGNGATEMPRRFQISAWKLEQLPPAKARKDPRSPMTFTHKVAIGQDL
jgi:hypothetical protein